MDSEVSSDMLVREAGGARAQGHYYVCWALPVPVPLEAALVKIKFWPTMCRHTAPDR